MEQIQPFSENFFIQRSFEVVWAVFRVAGYTQRRSIKEGLEERAVEYLLYKDSMHLQGLEEMVRLSLHIGEVSKVNADVLLREIGNLQTTLKDIEGEMMEEVHQMKGPEDAPNVEEVFSKPPMLLSEFIEAMNQVSTKIQDTRYKKEEEEDKPETRNTKNEVEDDKPETRNLKYEEKEEKGEREESSARSGKEVGDSHSSKTESGKPAPEAGSGNSSASQTQEEGLARVRQTRPQDGVGEQSGNHAPETGSGKPVSTEVNSGKMRKLGARERREAILKLVEKRNLCHIKDVLSTLPDTSARTLRYDIQKMVDKGVLERVGSGGPNSFFRLRKNEK
jgi:hypothetical protein